jgi:4-hydroxy-tetrahydrodipicolinate reductase
MNERSDEATRPQLWQMGLGPIGRELARAIRDRGWDLAGASDPAYAGRSIGEVVDRPEWDGSTVTRDVRVADADLLLQATVSDLSGAVDQLLPVLSRFDACLSTCEELAWPWADYPEKAQTLDERAREAGTTVLSTGVNPGFAMDLFPLLISGGSSSVRQIRVTRHADVFERRGPLLEKIGVGLTPEEFEESRSDASMGHRGLRNSVHLVASALEWKLDSIREETEAVVADQCHETDYARCEPGEVAGVRQILEADVEGRPSPAFEYELVLALRVDDSVDRVEISGTPDIETEVQGGFPGDRCTINVLLNYVDLVSDAPPGLQTVDRLPVPRPSAGPVVEGPAVETAGWARGGNRRG